MAMSNAGAPEAREFAVEGMMCEGCVKTVTSAVQGVPGVKEVEVSLADKKATVVADAAEVPSSKIEAAIRDAGYQARLLPPAGAGQP
jgi:copper ion binding protein